MRKNTLQLTMEAALFGSVVLSACSGGGVKNPTDAVIQSDNSRRDQPTSAASLPNIADAARTAQAMHTQVAIDLAGGTSTPVSPMFPLDN